jgi:hypothetical protein
VHRRAVHLLRREGGLVAGLGELGVDGLALLADEDCEVVPRRAEGLDRMRRVRVIHDALRIQLLLPA